MSDDSGPLFTEIIIIIALVVVNGVFAMAEMAMVSARKTRLQELAENGDSGAKEALHILKEPNKFLSTIQVGITLVGILAGVFGGATIAEKLSAWLKGIPPLAPYSSHLGIGIVVVGITYLSLVIGELVPKRMALSRAERIAAFAAAPMRLLSTVAAPVIGLLSLSTNAALRVLGIRHQPENGITEDEVKIIISECTEAGVFDKNEQDMVNRVLHLGDRKVNDLMTPRPDLVAIDIDANQEENWQKMASSGHSQFPVYRHDPDNILGIVSIKGLWNRVVTGEPIDLVSLLAPPLFIPEGLPALTVLEGFKHSRTHVALVVDEYGSIQGIITLHDILEATMGDLPSVDVDTDPDAVKRDDGSWLLDALLPVEKFKDIFGVDIIAEEENDRYHTVGGFMLFHFGRIPSAGSFFEWGGWRFEVVDMDGHRIDKVLIKPLASGADGGRET
ncbi:MAG: Magnesium and cobalt efflux protein CorC [Syntrophorhabdaceae bacterium PtaU1.Bin034]|nr:MAG: Magnesium and cobalt efflux protein CorC [Syntrophorhabdaceae bacterium PtaU1.Bin034]